LLGPGEGHKAGMGSMQEKATDRCLAQEFTHGAQEQQGLAFVHFSFPFSFFGSSVVFFA